MSARHFQLAAWLDLGDDWIEAFESGRMKRTLAARGVNSRGWRLYLDFGDAIFEALGKPWVHPDLHFSSGPNATAFLKLLAACEMDVLPPRALVASIAQWKIPSARLDSIPVPFFRSVWKACIAAEYAADKDAVSAFVRELVIPVAGWFFSTGQHRDTDPNRLKAGWSRIEAAYLAKRKEEARQREKSDPSPPQWPVFLRTVKADGLRFVALASDAALGAESEAMSHCIDEYGDRCRASMLRVYSVLDRKAGVRVATLTVKETKPGRWDIDAIKGRKNAEVPPRIQQAAFAVARSLEDAYAMLWFVRKEMDATRSLQARIDPIPGRRLLHMVEDFEFDTSF